MAERIQEVEETTVQGGLPVQSTRKVTTATTAEPERTVVVAKSGASTTEQIIYFITGVLLALMAGRFILSLLGANQGNGFADFIYGVTYPFVAPFFGLFGYEVEYGVARLEIETLVAMLVYALVAYGIVKLIRIGRKEA